MVIGLRVIIGLVARMYGEVAPELAGDRLMLQVELKCPRGWQPDDETRRPEGRSCRLQPIGPGSRMAHRSKAPWTPDRDLGAEERARRISICGADGAARGSEDGFQAIICVNKIAAGGDARDR